MFPRIESVWADDLLGDLGGVGEVVLPAGSSAVPPDGSGVVPGGGVVGPDGFGSLMLGLMLLLAGGAYLVSVRSRMARRGTLGTVILAVGAVLTLTSLFGI